MAAFSIASIAFEKQNGFTSDDRILIKALRIEKGYGAKRLLKEFPNKPWPLTTVKKLLVKIDTTGLRAFIKAEGGHFEYQMQ